MKLNVRSSRGVENLISALLLIVTSIALGLLVSLQTINMTTKSITVMAYHAKTTFLEVLHVSISSRENMSQVEAILYNPTYTSAKIVRLLITSADNKLLCNVPLNVTIRPKTVKTVIVKCDQRFTTGLYIMKIVLDGGSIMESPIMKIE